jgi:hypothetical protein
MIGVVNPFLGAGDHRVKRHKIFDQLEGMCPLKNLPQMSWRARGGTWDT